MSAEVGGAAREKPYRRPVVTRIEREPRTERLYRLENDLRRHVERVGAEWARVTGNDEKEFFHVQLPQVLFDTLRSFDSKASRLAARAYLELQGMKVWDPLSGEAEPGHNTREERC